MQDETPVLTAAKSYMESVRNNEVAVRLLKGWKCSVHLLAVDTGEGVLMEIDDAATVITSTPITNAVVRARGDSEVLVKMLTGQENPTALFFDGLVDFEGPIPDEMRIDAAWEAVFGDREATDARQAESAS